MSFPFSIVMICKNAEATIGAAMDSIAGLSDDVVVYDSGSTDGTLALLQAYGVRLHRGGWPGFGPARQQVTALARHAWVLMLDADEALPAALRRELSDMTLPPPKTVWRLRLQHHVGGRPLRFGPWRRDDRIRLYNKTEVGWNNRSIHENIELPSGMTIKKLRHAAYHNTAPTMAAFAQKMKGYAELVACQYRQEGKKATLLRRWLSPVASFVQNYVLKLGFLDGKAGLQSALIFSRYTREKYKWLSAAAPECAPNLQNESL